MVGRIGCHLVVRVQTRFTPCNTISYACKHILHLAIRFCTHANTFCALQYDFVCVQTRFTPYNTISYACKHVLRLATRFRTHTNTFCALQHDFVRMQTRFTSLQQLIRGSIWPLHRCSNWFGGQYGPLHRCSKRFGGQYDHYIVAATDSEVNMARYIVAIADSVGRMGFYIIATRHNSYVTYGYVAGSVKFASVPEILPSNAPTSLTFLQSCRQKRHER